MLLSVVLWLSRTCLQGVWLLTPGFPQYTSLNLCLISISLTLTYMSYTCYQYPVSFTLFRFSHLHFTLRRSWLKSLNSVAMLQLINFLYIISFVFLCKNGSADHWLGGIGTRALTESASALYSYQACNYSNFSWNATTETGKEDNRDVVQVANCYNLCYRGLSLVSKLLCRGSSMRIVFMQGQGLLLALWHSC